MRLCNLWDPFRLACVRLVDTCTGGDSLSWIFCKVVCVRWNFLVWHASHADTMAGMVGDNIVYGMDTACGYECHADVPSPCEFCGWSHFNASANIGAATD